MGKKAYQHGAAVLAALALALGAAGCNTMEGLGRDIHNAGEALEDAANGDDG